MLGTDCRHAQCRLHSARANEQRFTEPSVGIPGVSRRLRASGGGVALMAIFIRVKNLADRLL